MGEKGALRGRGRGPWMLAAILREDWGGMRVLPLREGGEVERISKKAEPGAPGMMEVWRTVRRGVSFGLRCSQV